MADLRRGSLWLSPRFFAGETEARALLDEVARAELAEHRRLLKEAVDRQHRAEREVARQVELSATERVARLEALRLAAIERARVEAQALAELELRERTQEHERRLHALTEGANARRAKHLALLGFGLAALIALVSIVLYLGKLRPESKRLQVAYDRLVLAERLRAEETKQMLSRAERRRKKLVEENEQLHQRLEPVSPPAAESKSSTPLRR